MSEHHEEHEHHEHHSTWLDAHTVDDARVISAGFELRCGRDEALAKISGALAQLGAAVETRGGIVGHIKAAVEAHEDFTVSFTAGEPRTARGGAECAVKLAAIVFAISCEAAEALVRSAVESITR